MDTQTLAPGTVRAYGRHLSHFLEWCRGQGLADLPSDPEPVVRYLRQRAGEVSLATVMQAKASLSHAYKRTGRANVVEHLDVREAVRDLRRRHRTARPTKPMARGQFDRVVKGSRVEGVRGLRDVALLLTMWHGRMRRAEVVALDLADVDTERIPAPAREAVRAWARAIPPSPDVALFRSVDRHGNIYGQLGDKGVNAVVHACIRRAGLRGEWSSDSVYLGAQLDRVKRAEKMADEQDDALLRKALSGRGDWAKRALDVSDEVKQRAVGYGSDRLWRAADELREALRAYA